MKLIISSSLLFFLTACATSQTHYSFRGLASPSFESTIDAFVEDYPLCKLGEFGDGITDSFADKNRSCVLGVVAHELKLTFDQGIATGTLANFIEAFAKLENSYQQSLKSDQAYIINSLAYSNYQILGQSIKDYREGELAAKLQALQAAEAEAHKIEAENAAVIAAEINAVVVRNNSIQEKIKLRSLRLQKESERASYNSVRKFLILRQAYREAQLRDIAAQIVKIDVLNLKVEATYASLARRFDGVDEIIKAILSNVDASSKNISAAKRSIRDGFDEYGEKCIPKNKQIAQGFSNKTIGCSEAIERLKRSIAKTDSLIEGIDTKIEEYRMFIRKKVDESKVGDQGTPDIFIQNSLGIYRAHITDLEATRADLLLDKVTIQSLVTLVETQVAAYKADEKDFMEKQELAMSNRAAELERARGILDERTASILSLYEDIEAAKGAPPEAGLLRLTRVREMLKSKKAFLQGEAARIAGIVKENDGYLNGFYKETLNRLRDEIAEIDKKLD